MRESLIALVMMLASTAALAVGPSAPPSAPIEVAAPTEVPPSDSSTEPTTTAELVPEAPARWGFTLGAGYDLQWRREVNPDYGGFRSAPQIFGNVRFTRWSLQLEYAFDGDRSSEAGAFRVTTSTTTFGSWARMAVGDWGGYVPFVSVGGGAHFDRVRTEFLDKADERAGSRRFLGLGGGFNKTYWSHVLTELEGRVTSEEATRGPMFALVLRLGVTF